MSNIYFFSVFIIFNHILIYMYMRVKIKKRTSYNITSTVLDEFDKIASKTAINKSRLVELLIVEWIKNQK